MYPQATDSDSRNVIRRALISVYKKDGIIEVAKALADTGTEIVSTGSTAKTLADAGIAVTPVESVTGFPECLDGRVKTLHPKIHAGILANREIAAHLQQLQDLEVTPIDLVVCNLYPFTDALASGASDADCVELIDVGGPTMVRAAAKNHASVAVVADPSDYERVVEAASAGGFTLAQRRYLAARAFAITAEYDTAIAGWMTKYAQPCGAESTAESAVAASDKHYDFPQLHQAETLRYGENPHQAGALYVDDSDTGIAHAKLLGGKPMSFNNYTDGDAAWRAAYDFEQPAVAVMKHANPCGIAIADDVATAHKKAHACDPLSAFGGVIAVNRPVTEAMALSVKPIFTEVLIAPAFEDAALEILRAKKNLRLLQAEPPQRDQANWKLISGGAVVQDADTFQAAGDDPANWQLVAGEAADARTLADLEFAWRAVRSVRSNAIIICKDGASVGVGMGQVNRVDSAKLAVERANTLGVAESEGESAPRRTEGAVAASDAFFPFPDGLEVLTEAGVKAIVQPGGSIRDEQVIEAAKAAGVTLYLTGCRHFLH